MGERVSGQNGPRRPAARKRVATDALTTPERATEWDNVRAKTGNNSVAASLSVRDFKSCSNRACPHQFGAQPNPYGTQLNYNNYNNNNNDNQAYGSNTNSFLNQMTNRQNQGQTNVNPYNNLFGGSTTNNQNTQSNLNQYNKLFGSSTTNNQGYFNQMQANPWGAVLSGFVGNSNNQNNNNNKNNFNSPWLG